MRTDWNVEEIHKGGYENLPRDYMTYVIKAYNNGAKIEANDWNTCSWYDVTRPNFDFTVSLFRVKSDVKRFNVGQFMVDVVSLLKRYNYIEEISEECSEYTLGDSVVTILKDSILFKNSRCSFAYEYKDMTGYTIWYDRVEIKYKDFIVDFEV